MVPALTVMTTPAARSRVDGLRGISATANTARSITITPMNCADVVMRAILARSVRLFP